MNDHHDIELLDTIYLYSRIAINREFSHTINNVVTSLSIQRSMLEKNLSDGDLEKARARIEKVTRALNKIETFSSEIPSLIQTGYTPESVNMIPFFKKEIDQIKLNPTFNLVNVQLVCGQEDINCKVDGRFIQTLLYIVFTHAVRMAKAPELQVTYTGTNEEGYAQFLFQLYDGKSRLPNPDSTVINAVFGDIPLTYMSRIIMQETKDVLLVPENKFYGFKFSILKI